MYTDGVTEAMNDNHNLYGEERMVEVLQSIKYDSPEILLKQILRDVDSYVNGCEQSDDITLLVLVF